MTAEMSIFDLMLDRMDGKSEPLDSLEDKIQTDVMDWPDPSDDFLNSILHSSGLETPLLDPLNDMFEELGPNVTSSAVSDSGMSSDMEQQLSPIPNTLSPLPASSDGGVSDSESNYSADTCSVTDVKVTPPVLNTKLIKGDSSTPMRRVVRLAPFKSADGNNKTRSILVPVTSQGKTTMRTFRIITGANGGLPAGLKLVCAKPTFVKSQQQPQQPVQAQTLSSTTAEQQANSSQSDTASEDSDGPRYPRLDLTPEEKRLLKKEGITLPAYYPLTKHEERELKRIRRKIRNKISAQDSRKRKKEYVDGLEERVKKCSDENASLHKKLKALQNQNSLLSTQIRRLQTLVAQGASGSRPVQPATCLMVLLLSLALVVVPNLRPNQGQAVAVDEPATDLLSGGEKLPPVAGRSRTLLFNKYEDFHSFLADAEDDAAEELLCSVPDHDYEPPSKVARRAKKAAPKPKDVLEVDDVWPPPKKMPPDALNQHQVVTSSLQVDWGLDERLMGNKLEAVVEEVTPNSTSETQTLVLQVASGE